MKYAILTIFLMFPMSMLAGCASYGGAESLDTAGGGSNSDNASPGQPNADGRRAEEYLLDQDISRARDEYRAALQEDPADGRAAAGMALTDTLLFPYHSSVTTVLTRHLGASASLNAQGDVIYGEQGFFYFLARGVPWEDGSSTGGIKTLLSDRVPWRRDQLDDVESFVAGLGRPVELLVEDLVGVADSLGGISANIEIALADDGFKTIRLPGTVFHDESLDLVLGKSELSLLRAAVESVRGGIYFVAAYEHGWTLERAFGEAIWQPIIEDPMHEEHIAGYDAIDYQVAHLNETLGRAIVRPELLVAAGTAFKTTFDALAQGITEGLESSEVTALDWSNVDHAIASDVVSFLQAIGESVDGPSELPFTEPTLTVDASPFFTDGRTVPMGSDLVAIDVYQDEFGVTESEVVLDEATTEILLEGTFEPPLGSDPEPELLIGNDIENLVDTVSADVTTDYDRAVSGSF